MLDPSKAVFLSFLSVYLVEVKYVCMNTYISETVRVRSMKFADKMYKADAQLKCV